MKQFRKHFNFFKKYLICWNSSQAYLDVILNDSRASDKKFTRHYCSIGILTLAKSRVFHCLPYGDTLGDLFCRYFGKDSKCILALATWNALCTLPNGLASFPERTAEVCCFLIKENHFKLKIRKIFIQNWFCWNVY